ncbi:MFS transporter [Bifidobacterium sp. DSM 109957]|uniref:MFS transporter n=1 Tax=Bifidobacterium oedipodis TaxID=2675322 RepID=A0A7Y0EQ02_9BIFI|nr:MFS transporter [Bifidobacterium sp. DSM 109957]
MGLLLAGQAASLLGSSIVQYAIFWWLVMQSDSGAVMGFAMVFLAVPQAVVSLFGGAWADRWNRKLLIMLPDALIALVTIGLASAFAFGRADLSLIFLALALRSAGAGVQTPAVQSFIPQITPEAHLLRVNSINSVLQSANMIAAPAIAAVLINLIPLWAILYVDVATAIIGVCFVAMIRVPRQSSAKIGSAAEHSQVQDEAANHGKRENGVIEDFRIGFGYAMRMPHIRALLFSYATVSFINVAPMNLTLLLMNRGFQGQSLDLGFVVLDTAADKLAANELAWSLGMVMCGAVLSALGGKRIRNTLLAAATGMTLMGAFTAMLGVMPTLLAYLMADFAVGVATSLCASPTFTTLQTEVDGDMQGRVFGLLNAFSAFGTPLGMLVFGPLADHVPVQSLFIVGGLLTLPIGLHLMRLARR